MQLGASLSSLEAYCNWHRREVFPLRTGTRWDAGSNHGSAGSSQKQGNAAPAHQQLQRTRRWRLNMFASSYIVREPASAGSVGAGRCVAQHDLAAWLEDASRSPGGVGLCGGLPGGCQHCPCRQPTRLT